MHFLICAFGISLYCVMLPAHANEIRITANGHMAKSHQFNRCSRMGSVRVQISGHTLNVPRVILGSFPNKGSILCLGTETSSVEAIGIAINVSRTRAGNSFYENWVSTRKLPAQIFIYAKGRIKSDNEDKFHKLLERGFAIQHSRNGLEFIEAGSRLFSVDRVAQAHKLYVDCLKDALLTGGHQCTVTTRGDALDMTYRFSDTQFPQGEWVELDERVHDLIQSVTSHP